jgi:hypothetical protein
MEYGPGHVQGKIGMASPSCAKYGTRGRATLYLKQEQDTLFSQNRTQSFCGEAFLQDGSGTCILVRVFSGFRGFCFLPQTLRRGRFGSISRYLHFVRRQFA